MPLPLAFAIASAAGEVFDTIAGIQNARAQRLAEQKRARENKRQALKALGEQTFDVRVRTAQERAQIGEEIRSVTRAAFGQRGEVAASAGGANVAGQSVGDLLLDSRAQEARAKGSLRLQQEFREFAAAREIRALQLQTEARILGVQPGVVVQPNPFASVLRVASAGAEGFAAGQRIQEGLQ